MVIPGLEPVPQKGIYRILVCRPNHRLGNTILLTPLISELERLFRGAEIDIISEGNIAEEVFESFFSVRNVYCLPKRGFKHPVSFLGMLFKIRKTTYDLIVDPCLGSGFSRTLTRFLKGRYKLGFSDEPERSGLTHPAPCAVAQHHMAQRPINLLRWAVRAGATGNNDYPSLDIRLTDSECAHGRAAIANLLSASQQSVSPPVVGIFANATGAKRYSASWWSEFIDAFASMSLASSLIELIPMHGHSMLGEEWPGYYSSDIRRMGAVMAGMDLVISADCGVMHLSVASKVPTVGLFCVTDSSVYAPYGKGSLALSTCGQSPAEVAAAIVRSFPELLGKTGLALNPVPVAAANGTIATEPPPGGIPQMRLSY